MSEGESHHLERRSAAALASGARWTALERVELSERFYRGVFTGVLLFVGVAAAGALLMLPFRSGVGWTAVPTIALTAALVVACLLALRDARKLYARLRRDRRWQLGVSATAAVLVAYPLGSELWWPACGLLVLVATVASYARTFAYCLGVLAVNLAAHLVADDLDHRPAVNVIGLWVGLIVWPSMIALSTDYLARHLLRLPEYWPSRDEETKPPLRVSAIQHDEQQAEVTPETGAVQQLTARQAQVVALLAGGLHAAEIAAHLSISIRQVQRHSRAAAERVGAPNVSALIAVAIRGGLAPQRPSQCPHGPL